MDNNKGENPQEQDIPLAEVKSRAIKGIASLLGRQVLIRVLGLFSMLVLARILTPEMFGVFAIAQFVVVFFEQFSSLGLSAALIRKRAEVTELELRTVFTAQQSLVVIAVLVIFLMADPLENYFRLDSGSDWLIRSMAVALLLTSLKTIPTVLLERRFRHDLLAASEIGEFLVYQITAISLALMGFGVWALVVALLARGVVGVVILCLIAQWRFAFGIDPTTLRETLRFGLPIQATGFVNLANNATIPIILGSFLGAEAVGYANFTRSLLDSAIFQPLIIVGRVQFRLFSRVQDDTPKLQKILERNIYIGSVLSFLSAALVVSQIAPLISFIVTDKWTPVAPLIYVLAPAYMLFAVIQPQTQALKALGDARTPFYASLIVFLTQIGILLLAVHACGLKAFAMGLATGIGLATLLVHRTLVARFRCDVFSSIWSALLAATGAGAIGLATNAWVGGISGMFFSIVACLLVYIGLIVILSGARLGYEIKEIVSSLIPNSAFARFCRKKINSMFER